MRASVIRPIQQMLIKSLAQAYPRFEAQLRERLLAAADSAPSDREHIDVFSALTLLDQRKEAVRASYFAHVKEKFDKLTTISQDEPSITYQTEQLSLVGKDEFDEWVSVMGYARALEGSMADDVARLKRGMNALCGLKVQDDANPLTAYNLIWSYKEAIADLGLSDYARSHIYRAICDLLLSDIHQAYEQIATYFDQRGLDTQTPSDEAPLDKKAGRRIEPPPKETEPIQAKKTTEPGPGAVPTRVASEQSGDQQERSRRSSFLKRIASALASGPPAVEQPGSGATGKKAARLDEVFEFLDRLPRTDQRATVERIHQAFAQAGGRAAGLELDAESRLAIETTESLVDEIAMDQRIGGELASLIGDLRIPLIKESLKDPDFLGDDRNTAKKVLQGISNLAPYLSGTNRTSEQKRELKEALDEIEELARHRGDVDFDLLGEKLDRLFSLQKDRFDRNRDAVIEAAEAAETKASTQERVIAFVRSRVEGRAVPSPIVRLLRCGWIGLLVVSFEAQGDQGQSWKRYSSVIDRLIELFQAEMQEGSEAGIDKHEAADLIAILNEGFADYPAHAEHGGRLIRDIEAAVSDQERFRSLASQLVTLSSHALSRLFREQVPARTESPVSSSNSPAPQHPLLERSRLFREQVPVLSESPASSSTSRAAQHPLFKRMKIGDWLVERTNAYAVRLLSFVWKCSQSNRFVFVDANGRKALDASKSQVVELFENGKCSLLEDGNIPLVERTVHRLFEKSFDQIRTESDKDALTGLKNRKAFERDLDSILKQLSVDGSSHTLVIMDVDRFSTVNDLCGINGGDELLHSIANIVVSYVPQQSIVARVGEDELAILVKRNTVDQGYQIAESVRLALEKFRFNWGEFSLLTTVSIGIVSIDSRFRLATELMTAASAACALAKQAGRNCSRVYQESGQEFAQRQRLIRSIPLIEDAIAKNKLTLFAQLIAPVFLSTDEDKHYEILMRVYDDEGKPTSPVDFIASAEKYGLMRRLDRWVVETLFDWLDRYHAKVSHTRFSINLSAQSFVDNSFLEFFKKRMQSSSYPADKVAVEVTETALMTNVEQAQELISSIKMLGCQFYLDDFGSGYSSYSYLKDLPVDAVKIDGIFVKDIVTNESSAAMVKSITEISHFLEKKVIAEYVENEAILIALQRLGVDYAQGYGIGRPTPLHKLVEERKQSN